MSETLNPEAVHRLERLIDLDLSLLFKAAFEENPAPDVALTNLERWLEATGNPRLYLEQVVALPRLARGFLNLLGASQPLADGLIQNPELATVLLDPKELEKDVDRDTVLEEGSRMLSVATSPSHALDRLRFLKQRFNLPIVLHDLDGSWEQERVWRALSDLADALIVLTFETVWKQFAASRDLPQEPPLAVVAFGKLGAREVNYSSDVDLVYVSLDDLDERTERECGRFCETFGRALSDKMGRGALYRVDLRLRPYGAAGPILRSMHSLEVYYKLYAEPWEAQALLKSRVITGAALTERWNALVVERAYQPYLSDAALSDLLSMRRRIEETALGDDLKRGAGGIRDVEFLCQTLQLAQGHANPKLRLPATCEALRAMSDEHILEPSIATMLVDGYTFLRKLEHRLQLLGDRQTHSVPEDPVVRTRLGKLMGFDTWEELRSTLLLHRRTIQTLYRSILKQESGVGREREAIAAKMGGLAKGLWQWFDVYPESDAFYRSLLENEGSLRRVEKVLKDAPRLIPHFKGSLQTTELLISGEIEEDVEGARRIGGLPMDSAPKKVAEAYVNAEVAACARWVLGGLENLEDELQSLRDALLRHLLKRLTTQLDVVALGSYGCGEMSPVSDVDLLFLTSGSHVQAEVSAQDFVAFLGQLKRHGVSFDVDLRLRPEGGKGLLVRTYEGFQAYELSAMEMWERFALGHARAIYGEPDAHRVAIHAAYALPLTPERLKELVRMKRRIETERVLPQHVKRNVKLGHGGLNDIEWLVHLTEMRYPTASRAGESSDMDLRIRNLGRGSLLNALEVESLLQARRHLLETRTRIYLLHYASDLLPENPDKLDRLAEACGEHNGNDFLRKHTAITDWVRELYGQTLERLRA